MKVISNGLVDQHNVLRQNRLGIWEHKIKSLSQ